MTATELPAWHHSRSRFEARELAKRRVADADGFEQRAHAGRAGPSQAIDPGVDLGGLLRRHQRLERARPRLDAEPAQEFALLHRPLHARAKTFRGITERLKVNMGGDIDLAGIGERIGEAMLADRLQRVAD